MTNDKLRNIRPPGQEDIIKKTPRILRRLRFLLMVFGGLFLCCYSISTFSICNASQSKNCIGVMPNAFAAWNTRRSVGLLELPVVKFVIAERLIPLSFVKR